jgi:hypothetical protein
MATVHTRIALLVVSPLLLMGVVACGEDTGEGESGAASSQESTAPDPTISSAATAEVTPTPQPALGDDTGRMADALQAAIPALKGRIKMTEDNDENELFGRPGQYDQVTFLGDNRLGCSPTDDFNKLDTACGVKIERWPSGSAAKARAQDIQQKLKDYGLGAEWDYVVGRLVVRASGDYKPSQAAEIQEASTAGDPIAPSD